MEWSVDRLERRGGRGRLRSPVIAGAKKRKAGVERLLIKLSATDSYWR